MDNHKIQSDPQNITPATKNMGAQKLEALQTEAPHSSTISPTVLACWAGMPIHTLGDRKPIVIQNSPDFLGLKPAQWAVGTNGRGDGWPMLHLGTIV